VPQPLAIPLVMGELLTPQLAEEISSSDIGDPFGGAPSRSYLGPRARWLYNLVLASLGLGRTDEIAILTTSQDVYVSICVSIPAFNYCRISRVVTEATKVVVVIHEFGYVLPNLAARAAEWRARGITIIEDCAYLVGLSIPGGLVGSFGDYALFSLSKILPTPAGGLLRTQKRLSLPALTADEEDATAQGRAALEAYLPHYEYFATRRHQRHAWVTAAVGARRVRSPSQIATPYVTYVEKFDPSLTARLQNRIQFGATLRDDVWLIPTNPIVSETTYRGVLADLQGLAAALADIHKLQLVVPAGMPNRQRAGECRNSR
jgi:hypothetical protein